MWSTGRPTARRSPSPKPTSAPSSPIAESARPAFSIASPLAWERSTRSEERRVGKGGRSLYDWSSDVCSSDLVISPPDGDMAAYMASLDKLLGRRDVVYWPTHGPAITEPKTHVRAFIAHRRERETGILDCLSASVGEIDEIGRASCRERGEITV